MMHLDLFSGIGGFALAARCAGIETVAFCEKDERCHKVLNKYWPDLPIHNDIKNNLIVCISEGQFRYFGELFRR